MCYDISLGIWKLKFKVTSVVNPEIIHLNPSVNTIILDQPNAADTLELKVVEWLKLNSWSLVTKKSNVTLCTTGHFN